MLLPLSLPVAVGELLTTLIRQPNPLVVPDGIVAVMVWLPDAFEVIDCNVTGLVKEPLASDNCAVNVAVPFGKDVDGVQVNGTEIPVDPAQMEVLTVPVVIVAAAAPELVIEISSNRISSLAPDPEPDQ